MRTKYRVFGAFVALVGLLTLVGCGDSEKVDTSSGNYGKADTTTQLPPQPNPEEVARKRGANPTSGAVGSQK